MTRPRLVVTRRWPAPVEAALAERFETRFNESDRPFTGDELSAALADADAVLAGVSDRLDAQVLSRRPARAKLVANCGLGAAHIDLAAARSAGITVTSTPDSLSASTADLTVMLMVKAARAAAAAAAAAQGLTPSNDWEPCRLAGASLAGRTLGLIGFGRVGQQVARRASFGFGMRVLAYDPARPDPTILAAHGAEAADSLDAVAAAADFLSLHCPGDPKNRHLVDARLLDRMKPNAFLINTARGEIVDGRALLHALWFETIAGAALDSYDGDARLLAELKECSTVVLTPHLDRSGEKVREALGLRVVGNIEDFFAGRRPQDWVDG